MIFTVPIWGSDVANSNTEIHLTNTLSEAEIHLTNTPSEVTWECDVTTITREGDFTLSGI